jgi:hypothetical protein
MDPSTLAPAAIAQALAVFIIQKLKQAKWFPWLTQNSALANRIVAYAIAIVSAAGITWQWHADQGQFVIGGLMWSTILQGLVTAGTGIVTNEVTYMLMQIKSQTTSTGKTVGAPAVAEPPLLPIPDKPAVEPSGTTEAAKAPVAQAVPAAPAKKLSYYGPR